MFSFPDRVNGLVFQKYGKYRKMGMLCIVLLYGVLLENEVN
jgi:hypothetical protein